MERIDSASKRGFDAIIRSNISAMKRWSEAMVGEHGLNLDAGVDAGAGGGGTN